MSGCTTLTTLFGVQLNNHYRTSSSFSALTAFDDATGKLAYSGRSRSPFPEFDRFYADFSEEAVVLVLHLGHTGY